MKKVRSSFLSILFLMALLSGCSAKNNSNSSLNHNSKQTISESNYDQIYKIYELYLSSGGTLTYEEWLATIKGEKGKDGTSLLTGSGAPFDSLGNNGDSYIDLLSWNFYVKENGAWQLKGNIKGDSTSQPTNFNKQGLAFYLKDDNSYSVAIGNAIKLTSIVIPEEYYGLPVSEIDVDGFTNSNIESIFIPGSVKTIDKNAFKDCRSLSNVILCEGLETIGPAAFYNCVALERIDLPNSIKRIEQDAFAYSNIKTINIPQELTYLGRESLPRYPLDQSIINVDEYNEVEGSYIGNDLNRYSVFLYCDRKFSLANSYKIVNGCKFLYSNCLNTATYIKSLIIPQSIIQICNIAFSMPYSHYLENIYYEGNETEWNQIDCSPYTLNENTIVYFYSEAQPSESGNYWHYIDDVPTIW